MRNSHRLWASALAGAAFALVMALTYAEAQTKPPATSDNSACAPRSGADAPTVGSGANGNLSDRLAQSNGVICPPASADKDMTVTPPQSGSMPVIPPPGTPGGDQSVQPK